MNDAIYYLLPMVVGQFVFFFGVAISAKYKVNLNEEDIKRIGITKENTKWWVIAILLFEVAAAYSKVAILFCLLLLVYFCLMALRSLDASIICGRD